MLLAGTISLLLATTASASKLVSALPATLKDYEPFGGADAKILQSPADWNRNTYPIPVHSHNDYERTVPVLEALSYGARSVESDVWLNPDDNVLYVGHDPFSLSRERTFDALTIQPLMWAIGQANRANANYSDSDKFFATLQRSVQSYFFSWNGYYSLGVGMTSAIQLMVDVKTNGTVTWPVVDAYENGTIIPGPITVVGTGSTPIDQVAPLTSRDTPFWPVYARNNVNTALLAAGSDWINADDLEAIAAF